MDPRRRTRARTGGALADLLADPSGIPSAHEADDAAAARAARSCYAEHGLRCVEPDAALGPLLLTSERVVAASRGVVVHARFEPGSAEGHRCDPGDLYVTTRRIVLVGQRASCLALDTIRDAVVANDRLVLILDGGRAVAVETPRPQLLRAHIAIARADRAADVRSGTGTGEQPHDGL